MYNSREARSSRIKPSHQKELNLHRSQLGKLRKDLILTQVCNLQLKTLNKRRVEETGRETRNERFLAYNLEPIPPI